MLIEPIGVGLSERKNRGSQRESLFVYGGDAVRNWTKAELTKCLVNGTRVRSSASVVACNRHTDDDAGASVFAKGRRLRRPNR
jgi:hypothetical protein